MNWINLFSSGSVMRALLALGVFVGASELRCYEGMFNVRHESQHPIDRRFEGRLEFAGTNLEMSEAISEAREAWTRDVERQSKPIETELSPAGLAKFRDIHTKWKISRREAEALSSFSFPLSAPLQPLRESAFPFLATLRECLPDPGLGEIVEVLG